MSGLPAPRASPALRWRAVSTAAVTLGIWSAPVVALLVGVVAMRAGDSAEIGPLGLVSALGGRVYLALAVLTASFLGNLFRARRAPGALLAVHVVVLAILLFGAATIIEPLPRMLPGWLHVGFADYIARTGHTLPLLDARFSWPGFFALVAMATRLAGLKDASPLLGWTPVVANVLFAAAVFRLARATSRDPRSAWLAVWLFLSANWVGQDYFGPQALNYLFYLIVLTVLLVWFRPSRFARRRRRPHDPARRGRIRRAVGLPRKPTRHEPEPLPIGDAARVGLMMAVLVVFAAGTVSHQLTPVAVVVGVAMLVIVRRCAVPSLPVLLGVIVAAYVSYFAVAYWSGHRQVLFGSLGNIGGTVSDAAIQRVSGDQWHERIVVLRLVVAAAVWGLAAAGAWRTMRRGHGDPALLALAVAPFLLLMLQSYGGEVLLRVYLFTLPFVAVLLSAFLVPRWPPPRRAMSLVLAGAVSATLIATFFVARYGNESFEQVRPDDARAVEWLYDHAQPGTSFVALTSNVPWRYRDIEQHACQAISADARTTDVPAIENEMRSNPRGAFLILTTGQFVFAETFQGRPAGWGENLERQVIASGHFRLIYENPGARVYTLAR